MVNTVCAIDFETACYRNASICAVGIARVRNDEVVETFRLLIKPPIGMEILPYFTNIHGIRNADVYDAPEFPAAWEKMRNFFGMDTLVAHNSSFDRAALSSALVHHGLENMIPEFECTLRLSRQAWPGLANHRLDTVSTYLGIELNHHEALSDAVACARLYIAARKKLEGIC